MKKIFFALVFLFTALAGFSQRMSVVAVFPFEFSGPGLTAFDAGSITDQLVNELGSWGTLTIIPGEEADKAEYLVKGRITRQNNQVALTATTYDAKTNKALNTAKEEGETPADISSRMFSFAAQVTENVPFPNYLLGKWRCVIPTNDGPLTCIMEFRTGRVVIVEQYDTWEQRGNFTLRYQGFGTGTYSYWGHARRTVRGSPVDGFVSISLKMEDALTKYVNFSISRQNLYFDDEKTHFELLGTGFACGDIYRAPESANPESSLAYAQFVKIQ
ncbi:MAG: hypothetical protein LBC62_08125 [Treponema sp.]|jgi:hypothetical protein|nr:hypothetical protein [Treponema sp.]